jgi:signal peptidase II
MSPAFFNVVRVHNSGAAFSFLAGRRLAALVFYRSGLRGGGIVIVWMLRSHPRAKAVLLCHGLHSWVAPLAT